MSESDVYRRQILTSKVFPRTVRTKKTTEKQDNTSSLKNAYW